MYRSLEILGKRPPASRRRTRPAMSTEAAVWSNLMSAVVRNSPRTYDSIASTIRFAGTHVYFRLTILETYRLRRVRVRSHAHWRKRRPAIDSSVESAHADLSRHRSPCPSPLQISELAHGNDTTPMPERDSEGGGKTSRPAIQSALQA